MRNVYEVTILWVGGGGGGVWFFFSSRRRHTRSLCDWSSDVCSSDLLCLVARELLEDFDPPDDGIIIGVDHVRALFSRITDHLYTEEKIDGKPLTATASSSGNAIHPTAFIDPDRKSVV